MKNTIYTASFILLVLLFSSCGINNAMLLNVNQSATQVHLTSNNFKVVDKVRGSAEVPYILLTEAFHANNCMRMRTHRC